MREPDYEKIYHCYKYVDDVVSKFCFIELEFLYQQLDWNKPFQTYYFKCVLLNKMVRFSVTKRKSYGFDEKTLTTAIKNEILNKTKEIMNGELK